MAEYKIVCPNSEDHKEFIAWATVSEPWLVDEEGEYLAVVGEETVEVVRFPESDDYFVCAECRAEATTKEIE